MHIFALCSNIVYDAGRSAMRIISGEMYGEVNERGGWIDGWMCAASCSTEESVGDENPWCLLVYALMYECAIVP